MRSVEEVREEAARYRQMKSSVDDKRTREVLETMASECEREAELLVEKNENAGQDSKSR